MMNVTQQIMRRFKINSNAALEVYLRLERNALDYTEYTQCELNNMMDEAFAEIFGTDALFACRPELQVSA